MRVLKNAALLAAHVRVLRKHLRVLNKAVHVLNITATNTHARPEHLPVYVLTVSFIQPCVV
jgi:hypothetical protein